MALVTTPGAADANSFATVAEFKAYHINRYPQIAWINAAPPDSLIEALLIQAARLLGTNFTWNGSAVDDVQALCFPRAGLLTRNGFQLPSSGATSIAIDLKNAQCEWAGQANVSDLLADNSAAQQGVSGVKAGSVEVRFQSVDTSTNESVDMILRRLGPDFNYLSNEVPSEVRKLLVPSWYQQATIFRPMLIKAF